jgi:hypothetical protein
LIEKLRREIRIFEQSEPPLIKSNGMPVSEQIGKARDPPTIKNNGMSVSEQIGKTRRDPLTINLKT